jgi:hypothetical protein
MVEPQQYYDKRNAIPELGPAPDHVGADMSPLEELLSDLG